MSIIEKIDFEKNFRYFFKIKKALPEFISRYCKSCLISCFICALRLADSNPDSFSNIAKFPGLTLQFQLCIFSTKPIKCL